MINKNKGHCYICKKDVSEKEGFITKSNNIKGELPLKSRYFMLCKTCSTGPRIKKGANI